MEKQNLDNKSVIRMSKMKTWRVKHQLKSIHVWYADSLVISMNIIQWFFIRDTATQY